MSHPSSLQDLSQDHQTTNSRRRSYQRSHAPLHSLVSERRADALPTHLLGCTVCVHCVKRHAETKHFLNSQTNEARRMNEWSSGSSGKNCGDRKQLQPRRQRGCLTCHLCPPKEMQQARVSLPLSLPLSARSPLVLKAMLLQCNLTFSLPPPSSVA